MTDMTKWCTGALPADAPAHQEHENSLKALAANVLRDSPTAPAPKHAGASSAPGPRCTGALGASGALGAPSDTRHALKLLAKRLGIPETTVDHMADEDLSATAEQLALCRGHLDRDGNPLASSLLRFYLNTLADRANPTKRTT